MSLSPIYTTAEVAAMERRSTDWIARACTEGKFPGAYRSGPAGEWRIPEQAVIAHRESFQPTFVAGIERRSHRAKRARK